MAKFMFVLSLCMLTYLYGLLTVQLKVFPYHILGEAKEALDAWQEVLWPKPYYEFVDENGTPTPAVVQSSGPDDGGYILMIGHPYALLSQCPQFGCMAWITDRSGRIRHSWEIDFGSLWADAPNPGLKQHSRIAASGLHLFDNGELLASFQSDSVFPYSIGMAKFDKDGNVLWKRSNYSHHKFSVAPDGLIYTPAHKLIDSPLPVGDTRSSIVCPQEKIYSDVVLVLDANGETIEEIDLFHLLIEQGYAGLLQINLRTCDPLHLNYVEYVTEDMAAVSEMEVGDLIVSSRHLNMVAAIDGRTRTLKWVETGRTVAQHSPRVMADGQIVVFDNRGGRQELGGSRIVRLTYGRDDLDTLYPRPNASAGDDFWSEQQGFLDPNPDGRRLLVSLAEQGLVIELDLPTGRTLWALANSHDLGPHAPELGAKEGDIVRLTTLGAYYVGRPSFLANQP